MTVNIMLPRAKEIPSFKAKGPISALTHFIAFIMCIIASPLLMMKGASDNLSSVELLSLSIFALSTIFL